jgi:hypothetical protein
MGFASIIKLMWKCPVHEFVAVIEWILLMTNHYLSIIALHREINSRWDCQVVLKDFASQNHSANPSSLLIHRLYCDHCHLIVRYRLTHSTDQSTDWLSHPRIVTISRISLTSHISHIFHLSHTSHIHVSGILILWWCWMSRDIKSMFSASRTAHSGHTHIYSPGDILWKRLSRLVGLRSCAKCDAPANDYGLCHKPRYGSWFSSKIPWPSCWLSLARMHEIGARHGRPARGEPDFNMRKGQISGT